MFSNRIATLTATAIAAAALSLAGFAGAATASASSIDDEFLNNIDDAGIYYDTASDAFDDADLVCAALADGETGTNIGIQITDATDLTAHQAAVLVVESAYAYCPDYLDQVSA